MKIFKGFFSIAVIGAGIFCWGSSARAADFTPPMRDKTYSGKYVSQSAPDPITMTAGEAKEVTVKFKNTGLSAWSNTGRNFVSVYTVNPNYRPSVFAAPNWIDKGQPAKIARSAKPGETTEVKITLRAPAKAGEHKEQFYLAAENRTWIQKSYFYLIIKVKARPDGAAASSAAVSDTPEEGAVANGNEAADTGESVTNSEYGANLLAYSAPKVAGAGGDQIRFIVRYINNGTAKWNSYLWQETGSVYTGKEVEPRRVNIADGSWASAKQIASGSDSVPAGKPMEIVFYFRMPAKAGEYLARFQLTANNHTLSGGILELPLIVTADAPAAYQETVFTTNRVLITEPVVRVGLYKAAGPVQFKSDFIYNVYVGGVLKGSLTPGELAVMDYQNDKYVFASESLSFDGTDVLRLAPDNGGQSYFVISNYSRELKGKGSANFNAYRGTLELKYSPKSAAPYVVNELPLDSYIAGIGETSNGAPMEYIKAVLTAARSYAYYQINNGVAADKRTFDVYASTADQLYLGYNSEVIMPRVVQAAAATYGEMVTYNSALVITPYFGHSDGRTRSWSEVWGGAEKPWLKSVECYYDVGRTLWGHGVGMSTADAAQRADKDAWSYDQILRHYYTGTQVEKIY